MGDEIGAVAVRLRGWRQARSSVVAARGDAAHGAASQPRPRTPSVRGPRDRVPRGLLLLRPGGEQPHQAATRAAGYG